MSTLSSGSLTAPAPTVTTLADGSTMVGSSGQLQFHLVWDSSVASSPAGFKTAAIAAASEFTEMYSNAEVVNLAIGFGEVGGSKLAAGDISDSVRPGTFATYAQIKTALTRDAGNSIIQSQADASLPATDPLNARTKMGIFTANGYYVTNAESKALGMMSANGTGIDGSIGLSSSTAFSYTGQVSTGQYDAIGTFEYEISAEMGRISSLGEEYGKGVYTPMDLFRYSSSGAHQAVAGKAAYFSIDGGKTNLARYDTTSADPATWASSVLADAFGYAHAGVADHVSAFDFASLAVLGYNLTPAGLAATQSLTHLG